MSTTVVDGVCTFGDLPPDQCAHCRGITTVDLDGARAPESEPATVPGFAHVARARRTYRLDKLGRILTQTAAVYDQLAEALHGTRGAGSGDRVTGGGGNDKPMPLQHQVAEHRHLLVRGLRYWCTRVPHRYSAAAIAANDTATVAQLVASILGGLDCLPAVSQAELQANMLDWQRRARVLTDLPTLRGTIPLGPKTCPGGVVGLWTCDGSLSVLLPADKGNSVALRCTDCGGRWDVADLPDAVEVRLSLSDAAAVTHTSVRTLQYRVQHGQLPALAGTVRLGDVLRSECAL